MAAGAPAPGASARGAARGGTSDNVYVVVDEGGSFLKLHEGEPRASRRRRVPPGGPSTASGSRASRCGPARSKTLAIPPGSRFEVLVYGPKKRGTYRLKAEMFDTGPKGDAYPGQILATVVSKGAPVAIPSAFPIVPDLRDGPIPKRRTIVFADTANPNLFSGDVEEWTIQNTAQEDHVFHPSGRVSGDRDQGRR